MIDYKIEQLMLDVIELQEFEDVRYYALHLRKLLWNIFKYEWKGVPYFLKNICHKVDILANKHEIELNDIVGFLSKDSIYIWVCIRNKKIKPECSLNELSIISLLMDGKDAREYVYFDRDQLICSFVCYILDSNQITNLDFNFICKSEIFAYEITDYKMTKVKNVQFLPSGCIFDGKYYLYSIFICGEKLEFFDEKPAVFKLIEEIKDSDVYMRLDERLAVPKTEIISLETLNFEKFRGIQFDYSNTKLDEHKNIIVHGNIETFDKLLMVIKKDYDENLNEEFWHVELEELPYLEESKNKRVTVTFIHGKYYPKRKRFRHIDYIQNQYLFDEYCIKIRDLSNGTIQIDHYTDKANHYKIWCVEETDITEEMWYKLAYVSLRSIYRKLLNEIIGIDCK